MIFETLHTLQQAAGVYFLDRDAGMKTLEVGREDPTSEGLSAMIILEMGRENKVLTLQRRVEQLGITLEIDTMWIPPGFVRTKQVACFNCNPPEMEIGKTVQLTGDRSEDIEALGDRFHLLPIQFVNTFMHTLVPRLKTSDPRLVAMQNIFATYMDMNDVYLRSIGIDPAKFRDMKNLI